MHVLHRYLINAENREDAISKVEAYLEAYQDDLYDYYTIGDSRWIGKVPPCISAAEVGVEEFIKQIQDAINYSEAKIDSYLDQLKKSAGKDAPTLKELIDLARKDPIIAWYLVKIFRLLNGTLVSESYFYDFEHYATMFTKEREGEIREDLRHHPAVCYEDGICNVEAFLQIGCYLLNRGAVGAVAGEDVRAYRKAAGGEHQSNTYLPPVFAMIATVPELRHLRAPATEVGGGDIVDEISEKRRHHCYWPAPRHPRLWLDLVALRS